jgi:hypothetical protein
MTRDKSLSQLSLGTKLRVTAALAVFLIFYIDWQNLQLDLGYIILGIIIALALAVLVIKAGNEEPKDPPKIKKPKAFSIILYGGLFGAFSWYWIYKDLTTQSTALPMHILGLGLLVLAHLIRQGGPLDPDRKRAE